uniref:ORF5 n=1 Tax=Amycolatopsis benzoatilytica TaxID=346045 RepID=A3FG38_9PSEU|nr:ORF5 [Amycolatopsis benzoatilytica]
MSLTTQLHGGELAAWCAARLVGTAAAVAKVDAAARGHRPVRPVGQVDAHHWAEIGGAFGLRLAALVEPSPAYYSLYGLVRAGLVSRKWADEQAGESPTHAGLLAGQRQRSLELRPTPTGWRDLGEPVPTDVTSTPAEPVLADLFDRTRRYLAEHAPPGQLGTPAVEAALARVFWLVSAFEDVYRTAQAGPPLVELFGRSVPTVEAMRAAAPEPVVAELVELARQLHTSGSLTALRRLAGNPPAGQALGHAAPVFVHHWADGDVLLGDGRASTLLDVKTVIRTDNVERTARWLWQLLGYAWLDTADQWRIRTVGLYLARHGVLVTWPADELAAQLLGERGFGHRRRVAKARGEFLAVAERVLVAEGARLPA